MQSEEEKMSEYEKVMKLKLNFKDLECESKDVEVN